MRALAQFVMRGPLQAGGVAALATAIPFLSWLGGAVLSLVILRLGVSKGFNVGLWALLPALGWSWFGNDPSALLVLLLAAAMAAVLRSAVSWEKALLAGSALGLVGGMVLPVLFPATVDEVVEALLVLYQQWNPDLAAQLGERLDEAIRTTVVALLPGSCLAFAIGALILARYWQAVLYNPGGFQREFHRFRLTRGPSTLCVVLLLAAPVVGPNPLLLGWVAGLPLLIAAIALVHGVVALKSASQLWLFALYGLLVVQGFAISLLLMLLAIVDSWLDIRGRIKPAGPAE